MTAREDGRKVIDATAERVLTEMEMCGTKAEAQAAITVRGILVSLREKGAEIARLKADNAELVKAGREALVAMRCIQDEAMPLGFQEALDVLSIAVHAEHPGEVVLKQAATARGMAELLYYRMMANGIATESRATKAAVETVGRWLEATATP